MRLQPDLKREAERAQNVATSFLGNVVRPHLIKPYTIRYFVAVVYSWFKLLAEIVD